MKSSLAESLMKLVDDGLRVFVTRDGVRLTDEQIEERTNNIVAALLGNYLIVSHVEAEEPLRYAVIGPVQELPNWNDPRISGRPIGHTWSCQCTACHTYKMSVRS